MEGQTEASVQPHAKPKDAVSPVSFWIFFCRVVARFCIVDIVGIFINHIDLNIASPVVKPHSGNTSGNQWCKILKA